MNLSNINFYLYTFKYLIKFFNLPQHVSTSKILEYNDKLPFELIRSSRLSMQNIYTIKVETIVTLSHHDEGHRISHGGPTCQVKGLTKEGVDPQN